MASVERAMAKAAAGLLPGLLPTPPRSTITTPCLIILPSSFASKPKPGRADSVERWDAHKKDKRPGSPSSSSSSSCGSSSPGRASSIERWDISKKCGSSSSSTSSSSSSSSAIPGRASLCDRWDSNKRPRSPSRGDRWDIHKELRSAQDDAESRTGEQEEMEIDDRHSQEEETMAMVPAAPRMDSVVFSGSCFFASPEPSMLPMPTFFRSRCSSMMSVPAH